MKNSPLTTILLVILALSSVLSLWLCWSWISNTRELRNLQRGIQTVSQNEQIINAVLQESIAYSAKSPAVDAVLQAFQVKGPQKTNGSAPATKNGK